MVEPEPGKQLLIASTGGHLAQLVRWTQTIGAADDSLWVTFSSPQSESLLAGRRVLHVPYVAPRDYWGATKAFSRVMKEIDWRQERFSSAVSTGAAVALSGLAAARLHRVPCFYFESISRVNGPSLTGRILSLDPGIHTFCQYQSWSTGRWKYRPSLFEAYTSIPKAPIVHPKLFVTLGTIHPYRFDALIDAIIETGMANAKTIWQLGCTERDDLPGRVSAQMSAPEFDACARQADVVITHSGVGTIMHLLEMGIHPVVVPRRAERNEHVDDHQAQIAGLLAANKIATVTEAPDLTRSKILEASARFVETERTA